MSRLLPRIRFPPIPGELAAAIETGVLTGTFGDMYFRYVSPFLNPSLKILIIIEAWNFQP